MSLEGIEASSTPRKWDALDVAARRAWEVISAPFLAERERWPLWLPAFLGVGIAVYFASAAKIEPLTLMATLFGVVLACLGARRHPAPFMALLVTGTVLTGFAAASWRSQSVAAPVLSRQLTMVLVSGEVAEVEPLANDGVRVVLEHLAFENREVEAVPERARLRLPPKAPAVKPGDRIRLFASLMPPNGPVLPGGFDFARHAWFQKLGAIGYGMGQVEVIVQDAPVGGWGGWLRKTMAGLRLGITGRILAQLPGDTGAVSAALVTGGERAISKPLLEAYRDSGLAHLLSVSGLHMSLVAGLVFVGLRALLALIGPLALNYPIKKWTAVGAAGCALFYLFLSGAFVPTQRSFLMTGIVLLGVVLDRQAISMRLVAWAAVAILLTQPESLLGASFQMSFAAVLALVALYERVQVPLSAWRRQGGWWRGIVLYVGLLIASSLVAGLATAPFALDNFNRFNPYGVASNMIAVPLSGVLVMPAALAAVLLMPLGLEHIALVPMGWGVDLINLVAYRVASWPGASLPAPSFSLAGLIALTLGGLWLLLMRRSWRLLGLLGIAYGLYGSATARLPDLLADGGNGLVALRLDERLYITPGKKDPITREAWKRHLAIAGEPEFFGPGQEAEGLRCDALACRAVVNGVALTLAQRPEALLEDCAQTALLVAPFMVPDWTCPRPHLIDRKARLKNGPHAVWLQDGRIERVETVGETRLGFPWARNRRTQPQPAKAIPEPPVSPEADDDDEPASPGIP